MSKKILLLVGCSVLIAVSCAIIKKSEEEKASENAKISSQKDANKKNDEKPVGSGPENMPRLPEQEPYPRQPEAPQPLPTDQPNTNKPKPITHFDVKTLDDQVREEARKAKIPPEKYRMVVRSGEYGVTVYRMIGMHVIVAPDGEETFLPDEI
ncbi:MAG TPA: hypothetical protein VEK06_01795 [Myxococcota bacterium]|nr:hypothetical protein [Myxococcota bacterium]